MRKSATRSLGLILALMTIVSVLAGCGGTTTPAVTTPAVTTPAGTTAAPTTAATTAMSKDPIEFSIFAPLFVELPDEKSEAYKKLTEETGVTWKITWVSSSDYTAKFQASMASQELLDVTIPTNLLEPSLNQGIQNGYFADLTDILGDFSSYPNLLNNNTTGAFNYMKTAEGRIMAIPRSRAQVEMTIFMRQDWMDKLSIKTPTTVYEWKDALKTIVNGDPDGNGKADTIGYAAHPFLLGGGYIDDNMASAFGAYDGAKDADGGLIYYQLNDQYMDYVKFVKEMYEDGLISKEFTVMKLSDSEALFKAGQAASYTRTGTYAWDYQDAIKTVDPNAKVVPLPAMKGTGNNTTAVVTTGVYGGFFINAKLPEEKIQRLVNYFEYTSTEEFHNLAFYGVEGIHYTMNADGTRKTTDLGKTRSMDFKSIQQLVTTMKNIDMKLVNTKATKEYNDMVIDTVKDWAEIGKLNHFRAINSAKWAKVWAMYQSTFEENTILAVQGEMSMDDYQTYVRDLRDQADMKECFQEFATSDATLFPEG